MRLTHLATTWANLYNRMMGGNGILILKLSLLVPPLLVSVGNHLDKSSRGEGEQPFAVYLEENGLKWHPNQEKSQGKKKKADTMVRVNHGRASSCLGIKLNT